jgi:pilus assembly protein Flp/PilA
MERVREKARPALDLLARFGRDESAATAIEYGLIAALVAVGLIVALRGLSTNLNSTYTRVGSALTR